MGAIEYFMTLRTIPSVSSSWPPSLFFSFRAGKKKKTVLFFMIIRGKGVVKMSGPPSFRGIISEKKIRRGNNKIAKRENGNAEHRTHNVPPQKRSLNNSSMLYWAEKYTLGGSSSLSTQNRTGPKKERNETIQCQTVGETETGNVRVGLPGGARKENGYSPRRISSRARKYVSS